MGTITQGNFARHAVRRIHTHFHTLRPTAAALAVAACFASVPALANPTGGTTTHGAAAAITNPAANVLQIQTFSGKTIMNWQSFSIGANELTRIMQPSALSALLNRVGAGSSPSEILGALKSNGRVFLINPNGITFGAGAQIDVGGFVASTLNLSKDDFIDGKMRFQRTPGAKSIINEGVINAAQGGHVYLVGSALKNSGIITAPGGHVVLAAGNSVELVNPGTPNLRVEISAGDNHALNLGQIVAESGRVGIYAGLIDQKGTIRADSAVVGEDGRILLKATKSITLDAGSVTSASGPKGGRIEVNAGDTTLVEGAVEATGASGRGGTVHLLGEQVGVYGDARVDASGETRGGTVLVGGAFQGKPGVTAVERADIQNASAVFFGADASIAADAVASGNGGKIILWSDDATRSHGSLSARGGAASGNGGLVETSGKSGLEVTRGPDLRAPRGVGGTWLVDPNDLEVVAGSEITNNSAQPLFSSLGESSKIGVELINLQLNFGSNVMLTTTNQGPVDSGQEGNIVVSAPILKTASGVGHNTLTLQAHNNIVINGSGGVGIAATGDPLSVNLIANSDNVGGGGIAINAGILTNGGSLFAQGSGLVAVNAPVSTIDSLGTTVGSIFLRSLANEVKIGEAMASSSSFFASGATGVDVNARITALNNSSVALNSSGGPVTVAGPIEGGFFSATAGGTGNLLTIAAPVTATTGAFLTADDMQIQDTLSTNGNIFVGQSTNNRAMNIGTNTAGSLSLSIPELGRLETAGTLTLGSFFTGPVTVSAAIINPGGPATVSVNSGSTIAIDSAISIGGSLNTSSGSSTIIDAPVTAGGSISSSANTSITNNAALTAGGNLNSSAGTTITANAPVIVGGNLNASAGTSITTGAVVKAGGSLSANAPTITIGAPMAAQNVTFRADNIALNALVTSLSDVNLFTRSFFREIKLGVVPDSGSSLDVSAAELNKLKTSAAGVLRVGTTSSGPVSIEGPIAPTNTQTLLLASGSTISQDPGATITVDKLALQAFGNVSLTEDNVVGTLAAQVCCSGSSFSFTNAPDTLLTIGSVAGINGVSNFDSNPQFDPTVATITTDKLDITGSSFISFDSTTITPRSSGVRLDLGAADSSGVLGISDTDLPRIFGAMLTLKADEVDISADVSSSANTLVIAPVEAGRQLNIVSGPKSTSNLEFLPSELERVTANALTLGDSNTGPITVEAAVDLTTGPGSVGTFTLRTGDASGITVDASVRANNVTLIADAMDLNSNVSAANGDLIILQHTDLTPINLGSNAGAGTTLNLGPAETDRLFASNGTLFIGNSLSGDVDVTEGIIFAPAQLGSLDITSGGVLRVHPVNGSNPRIEAPGSITLTAPTVTIDSPVTSTVSGDIKLVANTLNINDAVTTTGSDIIVTPLTYSDIHLGANDSPGALGLTAGELDNFRPASGGVLRIGDPDFTFTTGDIVVKSAIAPANVSTLSLITRDGSISQDTGATVTVVNFAAQASGSITLDQGNTVNNVALVANSGDVRFTHAGGGVLDVATVDGVQGIFSDENAHIIANRLDIDSFISADGVFISPVSAEQAISIIDSGALPKSSGELVLLDSEVNSIFANSITLGDTANTGDITVAASLSLGSTDLNLIAGDSYTITVNAGLTASGGNFSFTGGTLTVAAPVTSTFGDITATADQMTFTQFLTAGDRITLRALNSTAIDLGGPGGPGLALSANSLSKLSADSIVIGSSGMTSIVSNDVITLNASNVTLQTGGSGSITLNNPFEAAGSLSLNTGDGGMVTVNEAVKASGNLSLTTDNLEINSLAELNGKLSGANVTLNTATSGRNVDFGDAGGPTQLGLDAAELGRIATPGTFTVNASGASTLTVSTPVQFVAHAAGPDTGVNNLSLSAGTINVAGALRAPGDITLRANTMDIGSIVQSTGDAVISVAPRSSSNMTLGSGGGPGLQLSAAEINRFRTGGALRLGATGTVSSLTVDAPIIIGANVGSMTLAAGGVISQTAGSIITADRLRLQGFSTINLPEANRVGTLAGGNFFNTFTFTNDGMLAVGPTVDGVAGLQGGSLALRADNLALTGPGTISNSIVMLAPRSAGDAMNLGANPGGVFGISAGELDRITSFNVTFGDGTTGDVTVSSDMQRAVPFGTLNIFTAAANSVDVNGRLAAPSGVSIDTGTINVSAPVTASQGTVNLTSRGAATLNVDSAVSGTFGVSLISDVTNIGAPVISAFGTVTIAPFSAGREVNLGTKTSGALSLTADELAQIDAPTVTIGAYGSGGALTVSAPISVSTFQLNLYSGGAITQTAKNSETGNPGTPIILTRLDGNGLRAGNLSAYTTGGMVDLRAANEVPGSITGSAANGASDFLFNNELGLKLQSVGVSPSNFPDSGGKVRINSGLFFPLPPEVVTFVPDICTLSPEACNAPQPQLPDNSKSLTKDDDEKKKDECA